MKPAPTSGTITVVKQLTAPPGTPAQRVRFTGDISYDEGKFFLTAANGNPGRQSFIRAAGRTWSFQEELVPSVRLDALDCTSATGGSESTTDVATRAASVALGAGDSVTCTFRNTFRAPPGGLSIRKVTLGGVGAFDFTLRGADDVLAARATTTEPGVPARAEPAAAIADLPAGSYRVDEEAPPDRGGTWRLERVTCEPGGDVAPEDGHVEITVVGPGTVCTFRNRFTPAGRITLRKVTLGGTASTRFQVRPEFGDPRPERDRSRRRRCRARPCARPAIR